MKGISFSLSSSSKKTTITTATSRIKSDDDAATPSQPAKEFLTQFDPTKIPILQSNKTLIIPPKPNEWRRPHKKLKNLDLGIQVNQNPGETPSFEAHPDPQIPDSGGNSVVFGLNLREKSGKDEGEDGLEVYEPMERVIVKKLREELDKLPEDRGFEEFDDVPVEGYGAALLKGYGWYEGRGIGRKHKKDVKIVEFDRRAGKEGLGFVAASFENVVDNGEVRDGEKRKKKERERDVRIVGGRVGMGLKGRVLEVLGGGEFVVLRVLDGGEEVEVKVRERDVSDLGSVEEKRCLRKLKELRVDDRKRSRGDRRERQEERPVRKDRLYWLASNIRVRIISKEFKGGRFYLKKGSVMDVVGPTTCDICMDGSRELIQGVEQDLLETAIPRSGGAVLVLYGKHKGAYGSLLEKDMDKETAVVRDADSCEQFHVRLEQIAEYIGDPSDIGY